MMKSIVFVVFFLAWLGVLPVPSCNGIEAAGGAIVCGAIAALAAYIDG